MALGLTQPLTEMSTRNISWGVKVSVHRADNLTTFMCRMSLNLGASTSWNPSGPVQDHNGISLPSHTDRLFNINGQITEKIVCPCDNLSTRLLWLFYGRVGKKWLRHGEQCHRTSLCWDQTIADRPHGQTRDRHLLKHFVRGVYNSHHRIWYIMN